ncbi:MAG TPA: TIM barrel protein [Vicinamibacterales bacterium]|nr:TIM barrel protein [Vicinamibacterales bacterium]
MHLAYTCFAVRMLKGGNIFRTTAAALDPETFLGLCCRNGVRGAQIDCSQLPVDDLPRLRAIREAFEANGLAIELSIPSRYLETREAYEQAAAAAAELGATRARVGLLYGRRYEDFETRAEWDRFVSRWRTTLGAMRAVFDSHPLLIGIENHKDWLADDLVALLEDVGSPRLGVCLDFGNNLSLLEDPDETIERLAPFTVTTHLKDMAIVATEDGFEMSEVPLGAGFLPLDRCVQTVRRARPDVTFTLEMITRDPLPVPYRTERYWATFDTADRAKRVKRFEERVLSRAQTTPLFRASGLSIEEQIAAEDRHVAQSIDYASRVLRLDETTSPA